MGWYGSWDIKYNGKDSQKFVNLAKLIIPNYVKRFEETEKGRLECLRNLSWYNADVDISKIMEYLSDTDTIDVTIDGETHPIRQKWKISEEEYEWGEKTLEEDGEYYAYDEYDYEEQTFRKENGQVVIDNEHPDEDRYTSQILGVPEMFTYEIAFPESAARDEEDGNGNTIDSYIRYIAQQFDGNDEFMPIVQEFVYEVLDPEKLLELTNKEYDIHFKYNHTGPDQNTLDKISAIREKFRTLESTKTYLEQVRAQNPQEIEEEQKREIPEFVEKMDKKVIRQLGGVEVLLKLVEKEGEEGAKNVLAMLVYGIDDEQTLEDDELILQQEEKKIPSFIQNMSEKDINNLGGIDALLQLVEMNGETETKNMLRVMGFEVDEPSLEQLEQIKAEQDRREQRARNLFEQYLDKIRNSDRLYDLLGEAFAEYDEEVGLGDD